MLQDLLLSLRNLLRHRAYTLVAIGTLALGLGSALAIFSVTRYALFSGKEFPEDLVMVGAQDARGIPNMVRMDFQANAYEQQPGLFRQLARVTFNAGNIVLKGQPIGTQWYGVSPGLMELLGVKATLGRILGANDRAEREDVVVISETLWRKHFGASRDVLGATLIVGDRARTIVGVVDSAREFPIYLEGDVYAPQTFHVDPARPWMPWFFILARLQPGVSREAAQEQLGKVTFTPPPMLASFGQGERPALSTMKELRKVMRLEIYWLLLGAVTALYGIACLNTSNLILLRLLGRSRELGIRMALGSGRGRLLRLIAIEVLLLCGAGSALGLLLAKFLFPLLFSLADSSQQSPSYEGLALDPLLLALALGLALLTALFVILVPAFRVSRADYSGGIREGGNALGESPALARLRGFFVVLQVAFAVVLLIGAGLMISTFKSLRDVQVGFNTERLAKISVAFPPDYPAGQEVRLARLEELRLQIARIPGVQAVGFGTDFLLSGYSFAGMNLATKDGSPMKSALHGFNRGFQDVAGLRLLAGRWIDKANGNEIVVNETLAKALWPNEPAVGQFVRSVDAQTTENWKGWEVVGLVANTRTTLRAEPENQIFAPETWISESASVFIVRLAREADGAFQGLLQRELYAFDPRLVVNFVKPFSEMKASLLWAERLADSCLRILALLALLLTLVGIFSVVAYSVSLRQTEFGVRIALGANTADLLRQVLSRAALLSGTGVGLGVLASLFLTRFLRSVLYETSPLEPGVLCGVSTLFFGAALAACVYPAWRAAKTDPNLLLRSE